MNSNEFKVYHRFSAIPLFLICLYPAAQISGPFLTDLFLILIAVFFLFSNKNDKEFRLFETKYWKFFLIFYILKSRLLSHRSVDLNLDLLF